MTLKRRVKRLEAKALPPEDRFIFYVTKFMEEDPEAQRRLKAFQDRYAIEHKGEGMKIVHVRLTDLGYPPPPEEGKK